MGNTTLLVVVIVVALFFIIVMFVVAQFISLYVQANLSNCPVSIFQLIGMRLRKVDMRAVLYSHIRIRKAGIDIGRDPVRTLEVHWLAGGSPSQVTTAMIALKAAGIPSHWDHVAAVDLLGKDVGVASSKVIEAKAKGGSMSWEQAARAAPSRAERPKA